VAAGYTGHMMRSKVKSSDFKLFSK